MQYMSYIGSFSMHGIYFVRKWKPDGSKDTSEIRAEIYIYNARLAISCLRGSVGRAREYCTLIFLSSALLDRIPYATFIIVTIEKTIVFIFIKFSPFAISFLYFN